MKSAIVKSMLMSAAVLVVSACGQPGQEFVGLYSQNGTFTMTANGESGTYDLEENVNFIEGSTSDLILSEQDFDCTLPFNSDEFEAATIAPGTTCSFSEGGYDYDLTFSTGVVTIRGKLANVNMTGTMKITSGGSTAQVKFTWTSTLTRLSK